MTALPDEEEARHLDLIQTPLGGEWSGRARYAAAMYFYQRGQMDAATLEVYRICSRLDEEDPLAILRHWQIGTAWLGRLAA